MAKAKRIYEQAGRGETGNQVLNEATSNVRALNNQAVILAHKGDYGGAVEKLREAGREAPHNPRILMNAAWAMLKHLEQSGLDDELLQEARAMLAQAMRQSPGHTRLPGLLAQLKDVESRYGVGRRSS